MYRILFAILKIEISIGIPIFSYALYKSLAKIIKQTSDRYVQGVPRIRTNRKSTNRPKIT